MGNFCVRDWWTVISTHHNMSTWGLVWTKLCWSGWIRTPSLLRRNTRT
ncbi:unnamed protein product [Timema podura]|uniref:Uncharacterized protein n=1 Tax=Timema podura TaxID=61482 RepID=A0ABN7P6G6_TIMPD|nr:unnamed protein product [Timema podura]